MPVVKAVFQSALLQLRELELPVGTALLNLAAVLGSVVWWWQRGPKAARSREHAVESILQLRALMPSNARSGSCLSDAAKVVPGLDEQMVGFLERSPFCQLATADATGLPFVSPKGDAPGFVVVEPSADPESYATRLLIPDRPGNKLLFGLQNILENPKVRVASGLPVSRGVCASWCCHHNTSACLRTLPQPRDRHVL